LLQSKLEIPQGLRASRSLSGDREKVAPAYKFPKAYGSCSIGINSRATLPEKLRAIPAAQFDGIEISFPDLHSFTKQNLKKTTLLKMAIQPFARGQARLRAYAMRWA
jgi:hypothetical protein